jgi:hypothetical protein
MAEEQPVKREETEEAKVDKAKVRDWLQKHWTGLTSCPISNDNSWTISDYLVQPMTYAAGGLRLGGPGYPMVMVICSTCGYTVFFNAVVMNLLEDSDGE